VRKGGTELRDKCTEFLPQLGANEYHSATILYPNAVMFCWENFIKLLLETACLVEKQRSSDPVDIAKEISDFLNNCEERGRSTVCL